MWVQLHPHRRVMAQAEHQHISAARTVSNARCARVPLLREADVMAHHIEDLPPKLLLWTRLHTHALEATLRPCTAPSLPGLSRRARGPCDRQRPHDVRWTRGGLAAPTAEHAIRGALRLAEAGRPDAVDPPVLLDVPSAALKLQAFTA
eukprot:CAMPEP_0176010996 /NCGR_PEP_ID=MMETSP0120_2-20121206/5059_1 /TAXON_ID=160619 /ORGANISM="Kryptoperidinium foliaceum, Strain CCMP 1326" /LENGTH=147 /DNA_ID=CAMNT_0017343851 /DNA_START=391 /DNA_END=838 /DNA_ORIENTATION=+